MTAPRRIDEMPNSARAIAPAVHPSVSDPATGPSRRHGWRFWLRLGTHELSGGLASLLVHLLLLLVLALVLEMPTVAKQGLVLLVERLSGEEGLGEQDIATVTIESPAPAARPSGTAVSTDAPFEAPPILSPEVPAPASDVGAMPQQATGDASAPLADLPGRESVRPMATMPRFDGRSLEGRRPGERNRLALARGGTPESERAVEQGLRWLAAHQLRDGSWNFNHDLVCRGACRDSGSAATTTGATGVVLLAFLAAGYTQHEGPYQDTVRDGLYYLGNRALATPHGGDLQEGSMYGQALATIALCEAFALTSDPGLGRIAQQAIDFIVYAQDSQGGGWRYFPGQPGDTTVTGWQLMALKSGQLAELRISPATVEHARRYLDSVQAESGAFYGYQRPARGRTTTAVGLLCRMFLGWQREHPALVRGAEWLAEGGPAADDMYFNYYATQVLNHYGGAPWEDWNPRMREQLIATQADKGHENGSWFFAGGQLVTGGRVLNTALAVLTLEVYYRYLPLYGDSSAEDEFH